jgi:hypothetical protein
MFFAVFTWSWIFRVFPFFFRTMATSDGTTLWIKLFALLRLVKCGKDELDQITAIILSLRCFFVLWFFVGSLAKLVHVALLHETMKGKELEDTICNCSHLSLHFLWALQFSPLFFFLLPQPWSPYVPRDPNARLPVTFHVLAEGLLTHQGPENQVTLRGSLEVLGGWRGKDEILMQPSEDNPAVWTANVELPFLPGESSSRGIFEYKYAIEETGFPERGLSEPGANRRETKALRFYYAVYRHDSRNRQVFGGWKAPVDKDAIFTFAQARFCLFFIILFLFRLNLIASLHEQSQLEIFSNVSTV